MCAFLNERTQHSHGRDSANPAKMHAKVTSYSENPVRMHTKKSAETSQTGCGLRSKAYRTKRTLGPCPYQEKYIQNIRFATAVIKSERKNTRRLRRASIFERENTTFPWTGFSKPCENALKYQLDSGTACHRLQRINTESHKYVQPMQNHIQNMRLMIAVSNSERKKTRDFCDMPAFFNKETRHSHKQF